MKGFPALVDDGSSVSLKVLGSPGEQAAAHWHGVRRLLLLTLPSPVKALQGRLTNATKLALTRNPSGSVAVITGGASGIGFATARRFAAEGARVVIGDMNPETGEAAAAEVDGLFVQVDVTDRVLA